jgi:hypothetical protein
MDLAGYLGTVTAMVTLALGAMAIVAGLLGRRIDDFSDQLGQRIEDQFGQLGRRLDDVSARMSRLEVQNDAITGAVGDLGQRVARLQSHG